MPKCLRDKNIQVPVYQASICRKKYRFPPKTSDFTPPLVTGHGERTNSPSLFFRKGARGWVKKDADITKKYFF